VTIGLIVLAAAIAAAVAFGVFRLVRDGRLRTAAPHGSAVSPAAGAVDGALAERATLVQFSTAFCAPCRATRQLLGLVAQQTPGVRHVEIDAESHLELVRALGITRTPTTLVLDPAGHETGRVFGVPRRHALETAAGIGRPASTS
jgi:thiol-disulfide isomerase/thioredoxin